LDLGNGRTIGENTKISFSSLKESWYYVFLKGFTISSFLGKYSLNFGADSIINSNWLLIYLEKSEAETIYSEGIVSLFPVNVKDKLFGNIHQTDQNFTYLVRSNDDLVTHPFSSVSKISKGLFFLDSSNPEKYAYDNSVSWISGPYSFVLHNRWSSGFLHNGNQTLNIDQNGNMRSRRSLPLNGNGSIITIIDSGVDKDHCFFKDSQREVPFNSIDLNHRKIIRYASVADRIDKKNGHGTHCAGIAAGSSECKNCAINLYEGHATHAKLQIIDVGKDDSGPTIQLDGATLMDSINNASFLNSSIMSCSWGSSATDPKLRSALDAIGSIYSRILFIFAAGNTGGRFSINSPADSKNTLTVGASTLPPIAYSESPSLRNSVLITNDSEFSVDAPLLFDRMKSDPLISFENLSLISISSESDFICSFVSGKALLMSNSSIISKTLDNFEQCNVSAILAPLSFPHTLKKTIVVKIPESITLNNSISLRVKQVSSIRYPIGIAPFSSLGPTSQSLLKPEIFAPGAGIFSSNPCKSGPCCELSDLVPRQGTSMAAPAIAGIAALVEQYLKERLHQIPISIEITSTLIKAFIIQSGSLSSSPNPTQGYGLPILSSVLVFNDLFNGLRFSNGKISSNRHQVIKINITSSAKPFKCTLTWLDLPTDNTNSHVIVLELDLFVKTPSNMIIFGNQKPSNEEETYSTTERIVISDPIPGLYEVHIVSSKFPIDTLEANYSIVINGPFNNTDFSLNPPEVRIFDSDKCEMCESCSEQYTCNCNHSTTGILCQTRVNPINKGETVSSKLISRSHFHSMIQIPSESKKYVKFSIQFQSKEPMNLVRLVFNKDNTQKLSLPRYTTISLSKANQSVYIPVNTPAGVSSGSVLYLSIFADSIGESQISVDWDYVNSKDSETGLFPSIVIPSEYLSILLLVCMGFAFGSIVMALINKIGPRNTNDREITEAIGPRIENPADIL